MGGIGKTTTARVVYERQRRRFSGSSFIAGVGEVCRTPGGMVTLQRQLLKQTLGARNVELFDQYEGKGQISNRLQQRKVLIVIDDVNHADQLEYLAGDPSWFGPGSRIIITTRDEQLLRASNVGDIYKVERLDEDEALMLFQLWATVGHEEVGQTYEQLSREVASYCGGLPLALKVLGLDFANRKVKTWKRALDKLRKIPKGDILGKLKISYDGLDDTQKRIFLHISCIFEGCEEERITLYLDWLGYDPENNLETLKEKCLIEISGGCVGMHELLRDLGRDIVRSECHDEPGRRFILWSSDDIARALNPNSGTGATQSMMLNLRDGNFSETRWDLGGLSKFTKLKLLMVFNGSGPDFFGKLESLSDDLRYLRWDSYHLASFPSNFQPREIRGLLLPSSSLRTIGNNREVFRKLEKVHLNNSKGLEEFPDLSGLPNLRTFDLKGCTRLAEIRSSTPLHKNLATLNLEGCTSLICLPKEINFPSLMSLTLSGCSSLGRFPEIKGAVKRLRELRLDGTAIAKLPASVIFLKGLEKLHAFNCRYLKSLPSCIIDLDSLKFVDLSRCPKLRKLPPSTSNSGRVRLIRTGTEDPQEMEDVEVGKVIVKIVDTPISRESGCCSIM